MPSQSLLPPAQTAVAARLLADAEASLDRDTRRVRRCLRRLATLIDAAAAPDADDAADAPEADPRSIVRGGLAPWQVRRATAHVDAHLGETIAVADLAAAAKLSSGHFCRAFKVTTGRTPHAFVVERRLERAKRLMLETDEPLSQVAARCGLSDQAHLTRLFRRHLGATPLTWRRTWREAG
ncbi:AraC family transcriptional regulator [Albimonas sp. CAU 1670]|uniref:helix-turn-helix domain-containing protein n=1 Tax=Albimonas sp. CAU 1670 TaxID=3032599 RepID=UPI0023D9FE71|nr:AraC family transcriptional regulator [Albimonas sp. CAU 1670]MDF2234099.1 AraC family transcriptional regulator [Albimonas sp. CAU 1670]